jgi:hypothetical protein
VLPSVKESVEKKENLLVHFSLIVFSVIITAFKSTPKLYILTASKLILFLLQQQQQQHVDDKKIYIKQKKKVLRIIPFFCLHAPSIFYIFLTHRPTHQVLTKRTIFLSKNINILTLMK